MTDTPLLSSVLLVVPGVKSDEVEVEVEGEPPRLTEATPTRLAWFLWGVLQVMSKVECKLEVWPRAHPQPLLPQLLGRCLLLLSSLVSGEIMFMWIVCVSVCAPYVPTYTCMCVCTCRCL